MNIEAHENRRINLYADCIPVRGASSSAIYDLTRQEIVRFPSEFLDVLEEAQQQTIGTVLSHLEDAASRQSAIEFFSFLSEHEFVNFSVDSDKLPLIDELWETPCVIQNAIIDIRDSGHDYESIFQQLDSLGCEVVEIRCFASYQDLKEMHSILELANHTSIQGIELLLPYDPMCSDRSYIEFIERVSIVSRLTVHRAPEERELVATFGCGNKEEASITKKVEFVRENLGSEKHCGVIHTGNLSVPSTPLFYENKLYNGCLNKKISIDAEGHIKQCPSMSVSFGHHRVTSLIEVALDKEFRQTGLIKKDDIAQCRDCEFRYGCTDCRAYREDPGDVLSKPLKCGYNPYKGSWENWDRPANKWGAIKHYGLEEFISEKPPASAQAVTSDNGRDPQLICTEN